MSSGKWRRDLGYQGAQALKYWPPTKPLLAAGGPPGGRPSVQTSRIAVGAAPAPCADLQEAFGGTPAAAAAAAGGGGAARSQERGVDYSHIAVDRSKDSKDSLQDVLMGSTPAADAAPGGAQVTPQASVASGGGANRTRHALVLPSMRVDLTT